MPHRLTAQTRERIMDLIRRHGSSLGSSKEADEQYPPCIGTVQKVEVINVYIIHTDNPESLLKRLMRGVGKPTSQDEQDQPIK